MGLNYITGLRCVICDAIYSTEILYTCPRCGSEGILEVLYDYDRIKHHFPFSALTSRARNIWRYAELLPVDETARRPHLHIGWTPIYETPRLAREIGVRQLFLKDDGRNPTASFKDRASAIGVVKALELGYNTIACASTGNAASSLAGMAAAVGLKSFIFVPETAPEPKVAQLLIFGATVLKVKGPYEAAYDLCMQACEKYGWYNRNCAINPYLVEGKKTAGLEIAEQMVDQIPDWVVFSVGDGCTIAGAWKGLWEMHKLGMIDKLPKMLGVQAEGAAPIVTAFQNNAPLQPIAAKSLADSICVGTPRNWRKALNAIRASNGAMISVADEEILAAMRLTARLGGVFGEPAGVAGLAGLKRAVAEGVIQPEEAVLVVITGNGLKDIQSARRATSPPHVIEPTLESIEYAIQE
jgi:threonine synthase